MELTVEIVTGSLCSAYAIFSLLASLATSDYSWVDRLWSLGPWLYVWIFAYFSRWHPRLLLAGTIATIWGIRLSYNFWRKGGYQIGEEDYRWAAIQKDIKTFAPRRHRVIWLVFNVVFIATYQHILLLLQVSPAYLASKYGTKLNGVDVVATILFLSLLMFETIADEQQWRFQQAKHGKTPRRKGLEGDYKRGFLTHGLFRFSRHPNFFAEQAIWWSFYLFSVAAGAPLLNWTVLGPFLLTLLFQGSTWYTERLSAAKYKDYAAYQRTTSRLLPLPAAPAFADGRKKDK